MVKPGQASIFTNNSCALSYFLWKLIISIFIVKFYNINVQNSDVHGSPVEFQLPNPINLKIVLNIWMHFYVLQLKL